MEINYKNKKIGKTLSSPKEIITHYGTKAKNIKQRIDELKAAETLFDISFLPQARCHELKGTLKSCLAVEVSANYRIIFKPNHSPIPQRASGGFDWRAVTKITVISVEDYH